MDNERKKTTQQTQLMQLIQRPKSQRQKRSLQHTFPIMSQNFKAIGRGSLEIWRCNVPQTNVPVPY